MIIYELTPDWVLKMKNGDNFKVTPPGGVASLIMQASVYTEVPQDRVFLSADMPPGFLTYEEEALPPYEHMHLREYGTEKALFTRQELYDLLLSGHWTVY